MNERIIDKIRKLIAHEQSARTCSTPEEAAAFAAKIQQLCIDYKVSAEQVNVDDDSAQQKINHEEIPTARAARHGYGQYVRGEDSRLMRVVAQAYFCRAIALTRSNCVLVIGEEQDRAVCVEMFRFLRQSMRTQAIRDEEAARRARRTVRRFKFWFYSGFIYVIEQRYEETRKKADSESMALVRADALVKQYVAETFETFKGRRSSAPGRQNRDAALAGMRHGHGVSLSSKVVGG